MLRSYLKIAFRNFVKEKFYSAINVVGLSVGIAAALIIGLFIYHELSFDNFHRNAERIYRIATHLEVGGNVTDLNSTFPGMAEAVEADLPEVEQAVRLYNIDGRVFKVEEKVFTEDEIFFADPDFFEVFDFTILAGNPKTALLQPYQILLTPAIARKYFDTEEWDQVVGKSISVNNEIFQVTGIIAEAPANSHIKYAAVGSMDSTPQGRSDSWDNMNVSTYLLLRNNASIGTLMGKLPGVFAKHMENYDQMPVQGIVIQPIAQALRDIHLRSNLQGEFEPAGNIMTIYIFLSVALVVLLLASVNFVNLVTARAANRAKEVGVRKVLGSATFYLRVQFITECLILVSIAALIALGITELIRRPFSLLTGTTLPFEILVSPACLAALFCFMIVLGVLAGGYPAFFLSSFRPSEVLKGKLRSGFRGSRLRNALVSIQFVISIILITCTLIVQRQLTFMRSKKLGFDKENVLVIDNANRLKSQQAFISDIKGIHSVVDAGAATFRPVDDYDGMVINTGNNKEDRQLVNFSRVDHAYLDVLNYEFAAGRNFSRDIPTDSAAVILNEKAAEFLFGSNAMGQKLYNDIEYTVIGIVKDFNFESLRNEVRPLVFYLYPNQRFLHVRIEPGDYGATIGHIEAMWKKHAGDVPFSYDFLDQSYNDLYKQESQLGLIFNIFTTLALFIACLGLIGLAAYMAEQRKKEISVRKVLGATAYGIVRLLSLDFMKIIIVSFIIAVPVAYYMMQEWLKTFAYKTDVPVYLLLAGGAAVIAIALIAVSYQSIRAAYVNPVDSLKEE